ncbi:MAG TPA: PAS domain S-box protein [Terriglobia bacterium]|nr:PAS domain S-box protein [Terriglobia bacterium]
MGHSKKRTEAASASFQTDIYDRAARGSPKKVFSLYAVSFLIVTMLVVGFIWHDLRAEYRETLAYWHVQLSSSTDERVRVSALWLKERRTDTVAIAENPSTIRLLSVERSQSPVVEIRKEVEGEIAHMAAVNGFLGGAVGDRDCRIVAQSGLRPDVVQDAQEACRGVQQTGEYRIDTFGREQGHVWLSLTAPVMAEREASSLVPITHRIVGFAMMVAENWQDFLLTFGPESVPTHTSETLIVWKKAGEAFIFSPRLRALGAASFFSRPLAGSTFESRVAREGDVAFGEFNDYRGVRVLGAARRIAAGGDSVTIKLDWNEALSEYHRHRVLDWLAGTLCLLLVGSIMVAQHRHAAARDFAERAKQQEMLRESEERFRATFENAGVGMALVDLQRHPLKTNPALRQMLGYSEEELTGMAFTEFTHPDERELDWKLYGELLAGKREKYEIEKRYLKKGGGVVWGLLVVSLVKDQEGRPMYAIGMIEDISKRKWAEEERQRSLEQLRALAARLQSIREEERKSVAREIHDQLGQALTAIKIELCSLVRELPAGEKPPSKKPSSILTLVDESIRAVRRISTELRPGMLDDLGLVATIEWAGEEFESRTGTQCQLDLPKDDIAVDPERATAIFRIFQETLTNVARHAEASTVKVRLAKENGDLTLEVRDNGKGISEDKLSGGGSFGILGMRERAILLGGELTIQGLPGNGTTVRVRIPEACGA